MTATWCATVVLNLVAAFLLWHWKARAPMRWCQTVSAISSVLVVLCYFSALPCSVYEVTHYVLDALSAALEIWAAYELCDNGDERHYLVAMICLFDVIVLCCCYFVMLPFTMPEYGTTLLQNTSDALNMTVMLGFVGIAYIDKGATAPGESNAQARSR